MVWRVKVEAQNMGVYARVGERCRRLLFIFCGVSNVWKVGAPIRDVACMKAEMWGAQKWQNGRDRIYIYVYAFDEPFDETLIASFKWSPRYSPALHSARHLVHLPLGVVRYYCNVGHIPLLPCRNPLRLASIPSICSIQRKIYSILAICGNQINMIVLKKIITEIISVLFFCLYLQNRFRPEASGPVWKKIPSIQSIHIPIILIWTLRNEHSNKSFESAWRSLYLFLRE